MPINARIFQSFNELRLWIQDWNAQYQRELDIAMDDFAESVKHQLRVYAVDRMPSRGGSFLDSIQMTKENLIDETIYTIYSTHPWRFAIESGTQPHPIAPVNYDEMIIQDVLPEPSPPWGARYVHTYWEAKNVWHPGARAFRLFESTLSWAKYHINPNRRGSVMDKILKGMGFR